LAEQFVAAESLAHVKGRTDQRTIMALHISDPNRAAPVKLDFDITHSQKDEVADLVTRLSKLLKDAGASRSVALAALAEISTQLGDMSLPKPVAARGRKAS
jgi:hypothetical protein